MRTGIRNIGAIAVAVTLLAGATFLPSPGLAAGSAQIVDGSIVTLLYQITVPGNVPSTYRDVSKFVQGEHQILPILERAVIGMKPGEKKKMKLEADEAFGPYDAKKQKTVPRSELPERVKTGDILEDRAGKPVTIKEISDSSAVLDYNHPLAGKVLIVEVRILSVENPS
jgi:FKBP-type peptidyl-prolyl cis-trans isomerase 2